MCVFAGVSSPNDLCVRDDPDQCGFAGKLVPQIPDRPNDPVVTTLLVMVELLVLAQ